MSAITEIPAKTASPMGRTESFFPGSVNVDCDDEEGDSAAAAAVGTAPLPDEEEAGTLESVVLLLGLGPVVKVGDDVDVDSARRPDAGVGTA